VAVLDAELRVEILEVTLTAPRLTPRIVANELPRSDPRDRFAEKDFALRAWQSRKLGADSRAVLQKLERVKGIDLSALRADLRDRFARKDFALRA
jgi:hypothetical protein